MNINHKTVLRQAQSGVLSPEEQIRRNPELALDAPEPGNRDAKLTELLRWFHHPEHVGGLSVYVPPGHPSGLGGQSFYIPKKFAARRSPRGG